MTVRTAEMASHLVGYQFGQVFFYGFGVALHIWDPSGGEFQFLVFSFLGLVDIWLN